MENKYKPNNVSHTMNVNNMFFFCVIKTYFLTSQTMCNTIYNLVKKKNIL